MFINGGLSAVVKGLGTVFIYALKCFLLGQMKHLSQL